MSGGRVVGEWWMSGGRAVGEGWMLIGGCHLEVGEVIDGARETVDDGEAGRRRRLHVGLQQREQGAHRHHLLLVDETADLAPNRRSARHLRNAIVTQS